MDRRMTGEVNPVLVDLGLCMFQEKILVCVPFEGVEMIWQVVQPPGT